MERVDVAYVLLYDAHTDRVLMVQNEVHWSLPGGKREEAETLAQAAVREALEETGLAVALGGIAHISERITKDHVLFVTFRARITGGTITTGQDAEVQRVEWKSIPEAEALMPFYGNLREVLNAAAWYVVE